MYELLLTRTRKSLMDVSDQQKLRDFQFSKKKNGPSISL